MTGICYTVFLIIFLWMIIRVRADTEVSCVFSESCVLPCSCQGGADVVIHWIQETAEHPLVHSFYHNQDQLGHQNQHFQGRTSLFKDQISRGNVSLRLTGVEVQDEAGYKCHCSTFRGNKDSFIKVKVNAPVRKVSIDQVGNRITCSSNWIYPEPELTWSTSPPSNTKLQNTTTVQQTEQQLYNISSSLILSDSDTDLIYSCTVSTHRNMRRASWRRLSLISSSSGYTTISCSASNTSIMSLIWRFDHNQTILTKPGPDVTYTVSEEWRQHVKDVSESGSLTLQDLTSHQEGTYTCELNNSEETYVTNIFLRIKKDKGIAVSVGVSLCVGAAVAVAVVFVFIYKKKNCRRERVYTEARNCDSQMT
ncbi:uncharacterized protein PAE49_022407 [Odontesthes bonariensis]|uniref:uncharacterized protein LOC142369914 n=1 Tax=Odontesthes bonariensis TaxID=219752 RepID=UPI003F581663